jgi:RND family efflux transporter MFP subunit
MKKIGIVLAVLVVAFIIYRALTLGGGEAPRTAEDVRREEGIPVEVVEAVIGDVEHWEKWAGEIEGTDQAVIESAVMEDVVEVLFDEGESVKAGDVIIRLDRSNPAVMYNQAKAQYENAKRTFERMEALYEQGAISEQDYDQAKSGFEVAEANWKAAAAALDISSPISGVVTDIMVSPGETADPAQPLALIASTDQVRVELELDEAGAIRVNRGDLVRIESSVSAEVVAGTITSVSMSADPETRLFSAVAVADNPAGLLRAGSYATVWIRTGHSDSTVVLPDDVIVSSDDGARLFVVEDGIANRRQVQLGVTGNGMVEVAEGISPGEMVVTRGKDNIADGDKVMIHAVEGKQ